MVRAPSPVELHLIAGLVGEKVMALDALIARAQNDIEEAQSGWSDAVSTAIVMKSTYLRIMAWVEASLDVPFVTASDVERTIQELTELDVLVPVS